MRTLTATAVVRADHTLTIDVPEDIPPGVQTVVVVLEGVAEAQRPPASLKFSPHPVGPAEPASTYRRQDIYGDDGR